MVKSLGLTSIIYLDCDLGLYLEIIPNSWDDEIDQIDEEFVMSILVMLETRLLVPSGCNG